MTMMKCLQNKRTRRDLITYALVIAAFVDGMESVGYTIG